MSISKLFDWCINNNYKVLGHLCDSVHLWTRRWSWSSWMSTIFYRNGHTHCQKVSLSALHIWILSIKRCTKMCSHWIWIIFQVLVTTLETLPQVLMVKIWQPPILATNDMKSASEGMNQRRKWIIWSELQILYFREVGYCYICYFPWSVVDAKPQSFGLNANQATAEKNGVDTLCTDDYIIIPGGTTSAIATTTTALVSTNTANRFCGGFLNSASTTTIASETVCSELKIFHATFF